jgi:hypothetical protein
MGLLIELHLHAMIMIAGPAANVFRRFDPFAMASLHEFLPEFTARRSHLAQLVQLRRASLVKGRQCLIKFVCCHVRAVLSPR